MDIILLQNLDKVGEKYDVVTVKNGYGRNFLIPKGLALIANDTNLRRLEDLRRRQAAKESKMKGEYETKALKANLSRSLPKQVLAERFLEALPASKFLKHSKSNSTSTSLVKRLSSRTM